ncbi:hypothetical protein [Bathymodiolus thermophilus thioautotrophic gill symbiont]|uniref:Uncharacterized protein n=1 Tax=Bathymodiolus thermophilus thioautotrophic gill symbiont TaxID=2360 RepID=A0A1J5U915_9GAMM|nr:hypothetical protein [Bathymodiolus thermophilus thioautotrophic gill symbiont]OIR24873.1 hypothetical protein BGC33_11950 [Bathymodiolus thermophilus thioautotrophic gill symbiont]
MTKEKKTIGTNSMTKHSKELRKKTSAEWTKKHIISKAIKFNKSQESDIKLLSDFESIEAGSNKERLQLLVDCYLKQ